MTTGTIDSLLLWWLSYIDLANCTYISSILLLHLPGLGLATREMCMIFGSQQWSLRHIFMLPTVSAGLRPWLAHRRGHGYAATPCPVAATSPLPTRSLFLASLRPGPGMCPASWGRPPASPTGSLGHQGWRQWQMDRLWFLLMGHNLPLLIPFHI